jgi:hypothetical protein
MSDKEWQGHQVFEADWWGNCVNTFGEEAKQVTYAHRLGIINDPRNGKWPFYDMRGRSVVDLGGGPVSMLLKCVDLGKGSSVVDPCEYPEWISDRYRAAGISYKRMPAEAFEETGFSEAWIYNVLQHVMDPEKIVHNAKKAARVIRFFDWIDIPPHPGHPHELKAAVLSKWLGGKGTVEEFNGENGLSGRAFYGTFVS